MSFEITSAYEASVIIALIIALALVVLFHLSARGRLLDSIFEAQKNVSDLRDQVSGLKYRMGEMERSRGKK